MSRRTCLGLLTGLLIACANRPDRPVQPVSDEVATEAYTISLGEIKTMLTPKAGTSPAIDWSQRMYLNPAILGPETDSATAPLQHKPEWLADMVARGVVRGVCGKTTEACPDTIALVSLSVPWTLGGDTTYVRAGYVGEIHSEPTYQGVFYVMTIAPNEEGTLRVKAKSPPENIEFSNQPR